MGTIDQTLLAWHRAGEHLDEAGRLAAATADPRRSLRDRRGSLALAWAALDDAARITHEVAGLAPGLDARCRIRLQLVDAVADWLRRAESTEAIR